MNKEVKKKVVKEHLMNPSIVLIGYMLEETKKTIRNKERRVGKVDGKLDVIFNDERVLVYKDTSKFVKMYLDSGALEEYNKLSKAAQRLMTTIINRLEYNQDSFYYSPSLFSKDANINEYSVSIYIKELLENEWIFKSTDFKKYWVNLCYICIGDRDELYRKYRQAVR